MSKYHEKKENGFTLIELLIAMAAFSIVMAAAADIFLMGIGGTDRVFGSQAVQESGRFILESMSKEIRMAEEIISLDGTAYASLGPSTTGLSLNIKNSSDQNVSYVFDNTNKRVSRGGEILSPGNLEVTGQFYIFKNNNLRDELAPARVTITLKLMNKTGRVRSQAIINLQTTIALRQ